MKHGIVFVRPGALACKCGFAVFDNVVAPRIERSRWPSRMAVPFSPRADKLMADHLARHEAKAAA